MSNNESTWRWWPFLRGRARRHAQIVEDEQANAGKAAAVNGNGRVTPPAPALPWERSQRADQYLAPYRRLALQLHHSLPRPHSPRSVLLLTPTASTLSAYGSATLACCLGQELRRPILFVDACINKPDVSQLLNCTAERGFSELISNPTLPLEDLVLPSTCEHVSFLPAGATAYPIKPPDELPAILGRAENQYDFILLAGGSVLGDSLALALAPHVGCVLLLVIENETMTESLEAAQEVLAFCNPRKIGMVFTREERGALARLVT